MVDEASRAIPPLEGQWIQGRVSTGDCSGLVTLIDRWDSTSAQCLEALNYLKDLHERYAHLGLLILGVHSSEFDFARKQEHVLRSVLRFDVPYPVLMDNSPAEGPDATWPRRRLYDVSGHLRHHHSGRGGYSGSERAVQLLLKERLPDLYLDTTPSASHSEPAEGAVATPSLYLGTFREMLGSAGTDSSTGGGVLFAMPAEVKPENVYLVGWWHREAQFSRYIGREEGHVLVHYTGASAGLVMSAPEGARIYLLQDAKPLAREVYGEDVREENGHTVVDVREPRMYRLVRNAEPGSHLLSASTADRGLKLYAFRFV